MPQLSDLTVKIFADGADKADLLRLTRLPYIAGVTTNPTLMRKAGVTDYRGFAREILAEIREKPVSFEVFTDDIAEMERQAREIASWGENVYVKIPVTNTKGESPAGIVERLARDGVKINVTAMLTSDQLRLMSAALADHAPCCLSIFGGRIADTGRDPVETMVEALEIMRPFPNQELLWASPRELLNVFQANAIGCHIITVTTDILKKLPLIGKDLTEYSLETVAMFYNDAQAAGYSL
ncbi:MAG: transaldolase [Blastocatellia bacterium]|nr:transaldolase [Blastocatellia bacterium]